MVIAIFGVDKHVIVWLNQNYPPPGAQSPILVPSVICTGSFLSPFEHHLRLQDVLPVGFTHQVRVDGESLPLSPTNAKAVPRQLYQSLRRMCQCGSGFMYFPV